MSDAKSILLIDDNDKDRRYYTHRLKVSSPYDYVIFEAVTGQAGLDLFKAHPIDCVILELGLPDMSGFEVLIKLVPIAQRPEIPVVVLTRFSNGSLIQVACQNGAFAALYKSPTSGDDLDMVVHKALATIPRDHKKDATRPA